MTKIYLKDNDFVKNSYDKQAIFYDIIYGMITAFGRKHTVNIVNKRYGKVLEIGVGTGLSLPFYMNHLSIYSIDISPKMLRNARHRKNKKGLDHVKEIREMSADSLKYPDNYFDTVVAMYVMTSVPDTEKVMTELKRVCKPEGEIILVNHFSKDTGIRAWLERLIMPYSNQIGWRSIFPKEKVMGHHDLELVSEKKIHPANIFTLLQFKKIMINNQRIYYEKRS